MAENSSIEWTHHTFNPWRGCEKIAPGCANCYAEVSRPVRAFATKWGRESQGGTRTVLADAGWKEPLKWNALAGGFGFSPRVFCASLADVFEDWQGPMVDHFSEVKITADAVRNESGTRPLSMNDVRARLFNLIDATPHLNWLLATKRPKNVRRMWPPLMELHKGGRVHDNMPFRQNVWLLTSVSDQATLDENWDHLKQCRDLAPVLGISAEPLLGPLEPRSVYEARQYTTYHGIDWRKDTGPDWWIFGGESDQPGQPPARPCDVSVISHCVRACREIGVPAFVKQLGDHCVDPRIMRRQIRHGEHDCWPHDCWPQSVIDRITGFESTRVPLLAKKGGDMDEWPEALRVREMPKVEACS